MSLLGMSFTGAVIILVVTVIRALVIYQVPKKTFMILWGITLVRLLIPFSVPSALSVYTIFENKEPDISNTAVTTLGSVMQKSHMITVPNDIPAFESAVPIWVIIWAIGALVCAVVVFITYWKCYREFQTSLPLDNNFIRSWLSSHRIKRPIQIRQSEFISAPLTFGIFRPVILMPKTTDWNDEKTLQYVLAHEFVHIRRFDTITKLILLIALCVHWFNPFVWMMYILANRDIELSCDETVLRLLGEHTKASYAQMLISMAETKREFIPFCNNFSKNAIEERMIAIMKTKKRTIVSMCLAVCIVSGITNAFATSCYAAEDDLSTAATKSFVTTTCTMDGKTTYTLENGKTLDEEEYEKEISAESFDVEWWTYEEYKELLEQRKKELPLLIGEKGKVNDNEVVWTQELVDEILAMHEKTLQEIKDGVMHSKTVDGSNDISIVMRYGEQSVQHVSIKEEE